MPIYSYFLPHKGGKLLLLLCPGLSSNMFLISFD